MTMSRTSLLAAVAALLDAPSILAQATLTPLTSFGTNGWLAPGSIPQLGTANNERGFAYNPVTNNLVLVSRTGGTNVRVLDGISGADLGGLNVTGITGGSENTPLLRGRTIIYANGFPCAYEPANTAARTARSP